MIYYLKPSSYLNLYFIINLSMEMIVLTVCRARLTGAACAPACPDLARWWSAPFPALRTVSSPPGLTGPPAPRQSAAPDPTSPGSLSDRGTGRCWPWPGREVRPVPPRTL